MQAVTPFVGVWIEIKKHVISLLCFFMSLPSWECGLKCLQLWQPQLLVIRHSLRGSVDWNQNEIYNYLPTQGHSLRGSVDWNITILTAARIYVRSLPSWECGLKYLASYPTQSPRTRHSLRGSVDWNKRDGEPTADFIRVTPFVGVWIEIKKMFKIFNYIFVTPFVGVWIEIVESTQKEC